LTVASCVVQADEPSSELSVDTAIAAISAFEQRVEAIRFHCEVWRGTFIETETGWEMMSGVVAADELPTSIGVIHATSDVLLSPEFGKYRINGNVVTKTIGKGKTPELRVQFASHRDDFSNDGTQFRKQTKGTFTRVRPKPTDPIESWKAAEEFKAAGIVSTVADEPIHQENKGFMRMYGHQFGIGHVTPFVSTILEPPQKLSNLLQVRKDGGDYVAARVTADGLWELFYSIKVTFSPPYAFRVFYDPERGRIARCEWGGCKVCKEYGMDDWWVNRLTHYQYADDRAVIPRIVSVIDLTGKPVEVDGKLIKEGMQWVYTDCQLNPPTTDVDYRLTFDEGVEVIDYIDEKIYLVGAGMESDQKSVDRFLLYHGLIDPTVASGPPLSSVSRQWILIAGNVLLIGFVVAVVFFKKYKYKLWLLPIVLSPGNAYAQTPPTDEIRSPIHVRQCGHSVTMAVMQMRHVACNLKVIEAELKPSDKGVSLAQIKRFLSAYGLESEARKGLHVADLETACGQGLIAIVPVIVQSGRGHYLLVMQGSQGAIVVDVLQYVLPLSEGLTDQQLSEAGGFALFVLPKTTSPKKRNAAAVVRFKPEELDLKQIALDGEERYSPVECAVTLHNSSDQPVVVERIVGSCGCMLPQWSSGIVDAHSKVTIPIEISRAGWGQGLSKRVMVATMADGSSTELRIIGEGVAEATIKHGVKVSRETIAIGVGDALFARGSEVELPAESLFVTGDVEDLANLRVESTKAWIKANVSEIEPGRHRSTRISVCVNDDIREQLRQSRSVGGEVHFSTTTSGAPLVCRVLLTRGSLFAFEPKSAELETKSERLEMRICPVNKRGPVDFRIRTLSTIPAGGLDVSEARSQDEGRVAVVVSRIDATKVRGYVIRAIVESEFGEDELYGTVIVR